MRMKPFSLLDYSKRIENTAVKDPGVKMLFFVFLFLLDLRKVATVIHSLNFFFTASSQVPNFPEFVVVGLIDDVQIGYYDSNTQKAEPRQDWMRKNSEQDIETWTRIGLGEQQDFKALIENLKQLFNQTRGVHIFQFMSGCEWDEETEQVTSNGKFGYDGEDFAKWDTRTNTWIPVKQQAKGLTDKWNNNKAKLEFDKNYINQIFPEWLKKYVGYGRSSLMRTDLPSVSFLQKTSSSPVSCHATGFYPNRAEMFWRKDGEEVHDGVDKGEILPNNDGTFQMSVDIDLSSVAAEDWTKYECVFQLSGVKEDVTHRLEKTRILTNESNTINVIISVVVAVVLLGLIGLIGFIIYKKKKNVSRSPPPVENAKAPEETQFLPEP
ncbi:major histocompatibility complex class I-related gene protein-like isoform X2 [Girardinichthys multiradiatus]|uniref:major histocompatibility complex class I-related gene protein-like isoform X2 n=1 Tax=Girardinichthys multiradiatus TaxID=208333 RepID=UPI001FACFB73|nr:major histocompatibility complex class I-related gene protein-like isoform X2 [Girardinichthys multiradiatus]